MSTGAGRGVTALLQRKCQSTVEQMTQRGMPSQTTEEQWDSHTYVTICPSHSCTPNTPPSCACHDDIVRRVASDETLTTPSWSPAIRWFGEKLSADIGAECVRRMWKGGGGGGMVRSVNEEVGLSTCQQQSPTFDMTQCGGGCSLHRGVVLNETVYGSWDAYDSSCRTSCRLRCMDAVQCPRMLNEVRDMLNGIVQ